VKWKTKKKSLCGWCDGLGYASLWEKRGGVQGISLASAYGGRCASRTHHAAGKKKKKFFATKLTNQNFVVRGANSKKKKKLNRSDVVVLERTNAKKNIEGAKSTQTDLSQTRACNAAETRVFFETGPKEETGRNRDGPALRQVGNSPIGGSSSPNK